MTKRYYVDTNVLLSHFNSEVGGITKIQMKRAKDFLEKCAKENHKFILSDLTLKEAEKNSYLTEEEIEQSLKNIGIDIILTETTLPDKKKADKIERETDIHYPDSLHVQLALKTDADIIVTWNEKDFKKAKHLIEPVEPKWIVT